MSALQQQQQQHADGAGAHDPDHSEGALGKLPPPVAQGSEATEMRLFSAGAGTDVSATAPDPPQPIQAPNSDDALHGNTGVLENREDRVPAEPLSAATPAAEAGQGPLPNCTGASGHAGGGSGKQGAARDLGEAGVLLKRASVLLERHQHQKDHRNEEHLTLGPKALTQLSTVLSLTDGRKRHDEAFLLTVFQRCEEAVLIATDDCNDEGGCRSTLELAKRLVMGMLVHGRLEEIRTPSCRERLDRYIAEIDEIVRGFDAAQGKTRSDGLGPEAKIELKASDWSEEDYKAMSDFCEQRFLSLVPQVSDMERVEMVRQRVEWAMREKFRDAKVLVFGSSAGQLAMPESDIDLTLCLPKRAQLIQELKESIEARRKELSTAEEEHSEVVKLLMERAARDRKLMRFAGALRSKRNDLEAMRQSRALQKRRLEATDAKHEERRAHDEARSSRDDFPSAQGRPAQDGEPGGAGERAPQPELAEHSAEAPAQDRHQETPGYRDAEGITRVKDEHEKEAGFGTKARSKAEEERSTNKELAVTRLQACEAAIDRVSAIAGKMGAELEKDRAAFKQWTEENFDNATPEQKAGIQAVRSSRVALEQASENLKNTGKIVFEIRRIVERKGFSQVMAISKSRVPVVKTRAPHALWGPSGRPCCVDISVNNLVAWHNTRLLSTYTAMDPRCRKLLYLVKDWAKARGVNDSSKGTLSSYAHCVAALHYLIRVGAVPSLLKKHPSLAAADASAKDGDALPHPPNLLVEGIDVSFFTPSPGILYTMHPLPENTLGGNGHRTVTQRASSPDTASKKGGDHPLPGNAPGGEEGGGGEGVLRAGDAGVCDLLAGYFRYFAVEFRHSTQVMTIRPKTILCKREVWSRPKLWRTSIEDPFETHDGPNPHDLGWVLTRPGQSLLNKEWKRGHALMQKGGLASIQELATPCDVPQNKNPRNGRHQHGGGRRGNRKGVVQQGVGDKGAPNSRPDQGGGRNGAPHRQLWAPGQGRGMRFQGVGPSPPPRAMPNWNAGMARGPIAGGHMPQGPHQQTSLHHQQQHHPAHNLVLASGGRGGFISSGQAPRQARPGYGHALPHQQTSGQLMQGYRPPPPQHSRPPAMQGYGQGLAGHGHQAGQRVTQQGGFAGRTGPGGRGRGGGGRGRNGMGRGNES